MGKASRKKLLQRQNIPAVGEVKLSQALLDLCEPLNSTELSFYQFENLITYVAIAWNMSLLSREEQIAKLDEMVKAEPNAKSDLEADITKMMESDFQSNDLSDASIMLHVITTLLMYKKELYPHDKRSIIDFSVEDTPRGYHIQVKALKPDKPATVQVTM
jgi:hypothetical protein